VANNPQVSPSGDVPPFDPSKPHHAKPRLRESVSGAPVGVQTPNGNQTMLALADQSQIADRQLVTSLLAQFFLPQMTGEHDVAAIAVRAAEVARRQGAPEQAIPHVNESNAQLLIAQLDAAGLLYGPVFQEKLDEMRRAYDASDVLPPGTTAAMADNLVVQELGEDATDAQKAELGSTKLREMMDKAITQTLEPVEDPSFDELPKAVVAPALDYWRAGINFAHVYGRMRVVDKPARVVVLGVNNFGFGTGVVGCDKAYETPLGRIERDAAFAGALEARLGEEATQRLYKDRYDHEREMSVEVQLPWIQHVFGDDTGACPPVFAALVHDPLRNGGHSYDGQGLGLDEFVEALRGAIADADGRTLVVCSANFSHVGKSFGDQLPQQITDQEQLRPFLEQSGQADRTLLGHVEAGKPDELINALSWQQNSTRWRCVGPLVAAMRATEPSACRVLNYTVTGDQQGMAIIGTASVVME
jgi:AmmeMemoRadiSam system protein B